MPITCSIFTENAWRQCSESSSRCTKTHRGTDLRDEQSGIHATKAVTSRNSIRPLNQDSRKNESAALIGWHPLFVTACESDEGYALGYEELQIPRFARDDNHGPVSTSAPTCGLLASFLLRLLRRLLLRSFGGGLLHCLLGRLLRGLLRCFLRSGFLGSGLFARWFG